MSFGESASVVTKIRPGTIIAVINPRMMPRKPNQPADQNDHTFCIDSEAQLMMIGYSEEYDICKGRTQNTYRPGSMETFQCKTFLNKSVENICDRHKMEKKLMNIERQKG